MDINLPMDPPVNNAMQLSLCDKLDAMVFERTKVANTQLKTRLAIHDKVIDKHRKDIEKAIANQSQRLQREAQMIRKKKPDYVFDEQEASYSRTRAEASRPRSLSDSGPNLSYCRRYYSHHFHIKDETKKKDDTDKKNGPNDYFNMRLRLLFVMSNRLEPIQRQETKEHLCPLKSGDANNIDTLENVHTEFPLNPELRSQLSVEESDNEDVFSQSLDSTLRRDYSKLKLKHTSLPCLAERSEADISKPNAESTSPTDRRKTVDLTDQEMLRRYMKRNKKKRRRRHQNYISDTQSENLEMDRRRTKQAFEKIFNGVL